MIQPFFIVVTQFVFNRVLHAKQKVPINKQKVPINNRLIYTYNLDITSLKEGACMQIDTNTIVSVTEANQNFSRVTAIAEKKGQAVIFKNNKPKFILLDVDSNPILDMTDDEKIDVVAARILKKFKPAFLELAK